MAKAMLGKWEEAANDLHLASKLDYDEEISFFLKKVEPNARKIEEHHRKYERLRKEQEQRKATRERQRQQAESKAMYEKVKKKEHSSESKATLTADIVPYDRKDNVTLQEEPGFTGNMDDIVDWLMYACFAFQIYLATVVLTGTVHNIPSTKEFESKLNAASTSSRLAILYFTATWCGPCRMVSPIYTDLAGKYLNVVFMKIDIDELRYVAMRWNVSSVPTFFFIRNGKEIDKVIGADKSSLERKIAKYADKS
ncbi:hypothetical protein ACLOJK_007171 [Asimina triloba]